jgi:hypothetical protein
MSGQVREDFLDEDNEIPSQRFVLLSFLSPEKVLERKEQFFFEHFLKAYEIEWKTKNLEKFLAQQVLAINNKLDEEANRLLAAEQTAAADICRQSRIPVNTVLEAYQGFVKDNAKDITQTKIKEKYDDFVYAQGKRLEDEFHKRNNFQTTVRGLKVRGNYPTQEEATARAKKLQRNDPIHNIYVAEVGKWLAWDPNPHDVTNQEYAEDQLNQLMKSYKENEEQREQFFKQNPDLKDGKGKRGVPGDKIMSVVSGEEAAAAEAAAAGGGGGGAAAAGGAHDSLFSAPDLALQRKMERDAANKE